MVTASPGIGTVGLNVISAEVMLKSGRVADVKFLEAMLSVSFSSSIEFMGSIFTNTLRANAVGIVQLMLTWELPKAVIVGIVVSPKSTPPEDGSPS